MRRPTSLWMYGDAERRPWITREAFSAGSTEIFTIACRMSAVTSTLVTDTSPRMRGSASPALIT